MEERKVTPACGQQQRLQPTAEQSELSLAGGGQLTWQKMKVGAVELYINHCLPGEELG